MFANYVEYGMYTVRIWRWPKFAKVGGDRRCCHRSVVAVAGSAITGPVSKECAELWPRVASNASAIQ